MPTRNVRSFVSLELCFAIVADVVAVFVYVTLARPVVAAKSGNLIDKIAGRKNERGNNKHYY